MDYQALPPSDVYLMCEPDAAGPLRRGAAWAGAAAAARDAPLPATGPVDDVVSIRALAELFNEAATGLDVCVTKTPLGWNGAYRHFRHPLDFLGQDGGGGVGAGPGLTEGAALALKGTGRLPVGILGDGDYLMGVTALWTAVHYRVPCLFIVCNNRSFYNDEMHQERVAKERSRPPENKWIGQRMADPEIDLAMMARAQGAEGIGPVTRVPELKSAIERGIECVQAGGVAVIDARVLPGYDAPMGGASASQKR